MHWTSVLYIFKVVQLLNTSFQLSGLKQKTIYINRQFKRHLGAQIVNSGTQMTDHHTIQSQTFSTTMIGSHTRKVFYHLHLIIHLFTNKIYKLRLVPTSTTTALQFKNSIYKLSSSGDSACRHPNDLADLRRRM